MKQLNVTRLQAISMATQLLEYATMKDSSKRDLFKGFTVSFGDMLATGLQPDQSFEITPIPDFMEVEADN